MPSKYQKTSEEMLRKLEDKLTAKLMSRIENIVKTCKAIFEEEKPMISQTAIQTELQILQSKILNIQNDIKALRVTSLTIPLAA